jgi:hypothetical protein
VSQSLINLIANGGLHLITGARCALNQLSGDPAQPTTPIGDRQTNDLSRWDARFASCRQALHVVTARQGARADSDELRGEAERGVALNCWLNLWRVEASGRYWSARSISHGAMITTNATNATYATRIRSLSATLAISKELLPLRLFVGPSLVRRGPYYDARRAVSADF